MIALGSALTIVALSMSPGDRAVIDGAVQTSFDGASFDAAALIDARAGGLTLESSSHGRAVFRATGEPGPACVAAGVASPCLVPRLADIAHARLLTVDELRGTLRGQLAIDVRRAPVPPPKAPIAFAIVAIVSGLLALLTIALRRLRATPLGRVSTAAAAARRATRHDPTLLVLRDEIVRLEEEARGVERIRRSCATTLARTRDATHVEELAERRVLEDDLRAAELRLAEIAAALRLVPLRAREHRDVAKTMRRTSPMRAVESELDLRDRALAELD